MTIPTLVLGILALGAVIAAGWAWHREWEERARARRFAEVWEWRALRVKRDRPGHVDERARMVAFRVRPLTEADRANFLAEWRRTRVRFVEDPERAIADADALVGVMMHVLGVPAWTLEHDEATPLAWRHPELEQHYRTAHRIAMINNRGMASRVELEQALQSYKVICQCLLEAAGAPRATPVRTGGIATTAAMIPDFAAPGVTRVLQKVEEVA